MEEIRWWTRLLLVSAILAVVLLFAGPLGYKFELSPLGPSLISTVLALLIAVLVLIGSAIMTLVTNSKGLTANRNQLVIALVISIIPVIAMVPQIMKGTSVPPIHDISTDTSNPPQFVEVVALRADAINSLEYADGHNLAEYIGMQQGAYPEVQTLESSLDVADAVARAEEVLASQGLEVVNADPDAGVVEAVATTFWFGFKDDVVVRVTPADSGSMIDVRSVSRVGQGDVGANAARIMKFLEAF